MVSDENSKQSSPAGTQSRQKSKSSTSACSQGDVIGSTSTEPVAVDSGGSTSPGTGVHINLNGPDSLDLPHGNDPDEFPSNSQREVEHRLKARAAMELGSGSSLEFKRLLDRALTLNKRKPIKAVAKLESRTIVAEAEEYMKQVTIKLGKHVPVEIRRLVVAALCVHQLRLSDISMRDKVRLICMHLSVEKMCLRVFKVHVHIFVMCVMLSFKVCIIYHSCGDEIRAHQGRMWCFNAETGSLRPFSGLISDTILMDIQNFMMTLEGMFRSFGGGG